MIPSHKIGKFTINLSNALYAAAYQYLSSAMEDESVRVARAQINRIIRRSVNTPIEQVLENG